MSRPPVNSGKFGPTSVMARLSDQDIILICVSHVRCLPRVIRKCPMSDGLPKPSPVIFARSACGARKHRLAGRDVDLRQADPRSEGCVRGRTSSCVSPEREDPRQPQLLDPLDPQDRGRRRCPVARNWSTCSIHPSSRKTGSGEFDRDGRGREAGREHASGQ